MRWAQRVTLAVVAAALVLKLCDVAIGWFDPFGISHFTNNERFKVLWQQIPGGPVGWQELVPDRSLSAGVDYRINNLGFRGPEYAAQKPQGTFRIVALGDSVCFGWGVPVEARFTDLVERELNARGGRKVEVLNLAVPGYEADQEYHVFQRKGLKLQPDLVLFFFNQNDVQIDSSEKQNIPDLARDRGRSTWPLEVLINDAWPRRLLETTLPNVRHLFMYQLIYRMSPQDEAALKAEYRKMTKGTALALDLYARAKGEAEASGCKLALFDLHNVPEIASGCSERKIPYASIAWSGSTLDRDLRNSASDPHPNARGHGLLAANALKALEDLGLLPEDLRKKQH